MPTNKDTEKQPLTVSQNSSSAGRDSLGCFLRHITTVARLTGLAVLAVMWAATVTSLRGDIKAPTYVGYYLLVASLLLTFFEITWVLDKMACCVRQGCCCRCWSVILWVDGWRKFILYTAMSIPLFLQGLQGVIDVVSGFCLLVLACLYLVKSFASVRSGPGVHEPIAGTVQISVVRHEIATQTDLSQTPVEQKVAPTNPFETDEAEEEEDNEKEGRGRTDHVENKDGKLSEDAKSEKAENK